MRLTAPYSPLRALDGKLSLGHLVDAMKSSDCQRRIYDAARRACYLRHSDEGVAEAHLHEGTAAFSEHDTCTDADLHTSAVEDVIDALWSTNEVNVELLGHIVRYAPAVLGSRLIFLRRGRLIYIGSCEVFSKV